MVFLKKLFESIGLLSLVLFSFYYTNKVVTVQNNKDSIMVSIKNYALENNSECYEGYITEEGVVLGDSGEIVNIALSYSTMKGVGYSEDLMVFEEEKCILTKESNLNNYIIRGNERRRSVSIIIDVVDFKYLKQIISICEGKKVKLSIAVTGKELEDNEEYLNVLFNSGYDILYSGDNEEDFKNFTKILKNFYSEFNTFCLYDENHDVISFCSKHKINSIKTKYIFKKDLYLNIKNTLDKGNIIIISENKNALDELNIIINFLNSKGLKISKTTEHIK